MLAQKKMLSLEELEAQTMVALPDRELMHVHKGGSHHAASSTSTTTTTTSVTCSQSNAHSNNALLSLFPFFAPLNAPILSCNS
jgi:thiazolylpeptide-type bacteriocin precursor